MKLIAGILTLAAATSSVAAPRPETAVLAGGCFWGMESVFEHVKGVTNVVSGYAGGRAGDANYDAVSSESTGHAEAVKITYDPSRISYAQLLQIYFTVAHDPTQVNRQSPDVGTSYRSAIFPQSPSRRPSPRRLSPGSMQPICTKRRSPPGSRTAAFMRRKIIIRALLASTRTIPIFSSTTGRR